MSYGRCSSFLGQNALCIISRYGCSMYDIMLGSGDTIIRKFYDSSFTVQQAQACQFISELIMLRDNMLMFSDATFLLSYCDIQSIINSVSTL